jgi:hypothetical protein
MVFRTTITHPDDTIEILQTTSQPIVCSKQGLLYIGDLFSVIWLWHFIACVSFFILFLVYFIFCTPHQISFE